MSVRSNHSRQSETLRQVVINGETYNVFNGDFTTPQIVRSTIAKLKRGTLAYDKSIHTITVHGGIFEPVHIQQ